jgi:hypothetical protein
MSGINKEQKGEKEHGTTVSLKSWKATNLSELSSFLLDSCSRRGDLRRPVYLD